MGCWSNWLLKRRLAKAAKEEKRLEAAKKRAEFQAVSESQDTPRSSKDDKDDGFDAMGFAIGMATGIPLSPSRGLSTGALLGAVLHSDHHHSEPTPTKAAEVPAPVANTNYDYTPPKEVESSPEPSYSAPEPSYSAPEPSSSSPEPSSSFSTDSSSFSTDSSSSSSSGGSFDSN